MTLASGTGRIARFDEPGKPFEIQTVPIPEVGPGEVLIRVTRANICGSDVHAWHGTFATRGLGGQLPTVLGHEMIGTVAVLGDGVDKDSDGRPLEVGTRVVFPYFFCCHTCRNCLAGRRNACLNLKMAMLGRADEPPYFVGGYADFYLLPAGAVLYTVPDSVSDEIAAGANCALSQVMYGLERVDLQLGETVVVQGAGALGLYAVAVAKARGAKTVIAIDGVPERLELARAFGADEVIDITTTSDKDRVKTVRRLTDGQGADVVVEVVGHPSAIDEGLKLLAQFGRYVEIGNINIGKTFEFDPSRFVFSNKTMVGVSLYDPAVLSRALAFLQEYQDRLPFDRLAAACYTLENINEAFAAAEEKRDVRASIVP
ncbi:zinc-binding dehydrogenase [Mycolicibacterium phlei]|jgi:threonine dehydrogenase-like Zn-dependent dehydrogenase|uniref:Zinc-binding alcohol dehydrogenase n=1 Tax=Mycolicibacterium phlei DSM 43239 = CCUG 21000 TaxID=1226750 RepID=A0A5N5V420_MYCPH|nr:zinc-binding dehydrogenase [Mycolicibacterium phlei]VEG09543.1 alcohol dehydrogenase, zinc-containing [Mycobacteroides chelonae]AMO61429.1 5-exo-hydroxycamphor dehydrogenase [Mycolicibacterium phlei]EID15437.1 5-exo-alcohol dehydrogenase [Mycolicibacterium phlei RIVM601174]KAB7755270.1 zinc-binding alcohol dehydrogenase [Mycolicibacterium phlei DSM 43239 = CCUG 21000]KXW64716.1 zinc-binding alcohol dehydrogenase [Mycolicibacterium phlei DSM 43239 = CCUG 21000]